MKYLFHIILILLALAFVPALTSKTNTTDFYSKELGYDLNYQSFSGFEDVDWYYPK